MDETAIAVEPLQPRAASGPARAATDQPLDRISLRDHVRALEIGAFHAERGVTQRVRFDVALEVVPGLAGQADDVDRVLSYDTIVAAIDAALAAERLNLLETLAERIAAGCLANPRAARAFVRVEKLDRLPDGPGGALGGALGVEIVRRRLPDGSVRLRGPDLAATTPRARVIHLADPSEAFLAAALAAPGAILTVAPATPQPPATDESTLRIGLLAIEQAAWALRARAPALAVAASRTELDWALGAGRPAVWAPSKMLTDALPRPALDASRPAALAAWLAAELGAGTLTLAGGPPDRSVADASASDRSAADPGAADLAAADLPAGVALRRAARPDEL